MTRNRVGTIRRLAADAAGERQLSDVHPHVTDEVIALRQLPVAHVAGETFLVSVDVEVLFQFAEIYKLFTTNAAHVNALIQRLPTTIGSLVFTNLARSLLRTIIIDLKLIGIQDLLFVDAAGSCLWMILV